MTPPIPRHPGVVLVGALAPAGEEAACQRQAVTDGQTLVSTDVEVVGPETVQRRPGLDTDVFAPGPDSDCCECSRDRVTLTVVSRADVRKS